MTDRRRRERSIRRLVPLGWELVVAPLVLVGYPAMAGGLGWGAAFTFVPDLSLAVGTIAGLAVLTGIVRLARLLLTRTGPGDELESPQRVNVPTIATSSRPAPDEVLDAGVSPSWDIRA